MSGPPALTTNAAFAPSDDQREILAHVDRVARTEVYPLQQRMDDEEWWPAHTFRLFGANGYLGVTAPTDLGGAGLDSFVSGLIVQAVARWNPADMYAALQIHGGAGYIWETEINRLYRAGKHWEIGAGTTEIRQLIIAQAVLGL